MAIKEKAGSIDSMDVVM